MSLDPIRCGHTMLGHLFRHPLCANQTLAKKVFNIASAIFLCGSALVVVGRALAHAGRVSKSPPPAEPQQTLETRPMHYELDLPAEHYPAGAAAIWDAIRAVPTTATPTVEQFCASGISASKTHQPVNVQITYLQALLGVQSLSLNAAIEQQGANWVKDEATNNLAHKCMQTAYAISCLTLEDLPAFRANLTRTIVKALTLQDSYQYRTFFTCTQMYHQLRGGLFCLGSDWCYLQGQTAEKHATLFYQEGTIQYAWRMLYNDYCQHVREVAPGLGTEHAGRRFVSWTQPDNSPKDFAPVPDTLPT